MVQEELRHKTEVLAVGLTEQRREDEKSTTHVLLNCGILCSCARQSQKMTVSPSDRSHSPEGERGGTWSGGDAAHIHTGRSQQ